MFEERTLRLLMARPVILFTVGFQQSVPPRNNAGIKQRILSAAATAAGGVRADELLPFFASGVNGEDREIGPVPNKRARKVWFLNICRARWAGRILSASVPMQCTTRS